MKTFLIGVALAATLAVLVPTRAGADEIAPAPVAAKTPVVTWKDSEQKTLFTSDDILFFDWENQYFLLKDAAFQNYLSWIDNRKLSKEIVVEDKDGLIYQARWEIGNSSMGHGYPTYYLGKGSRFVSRDIIYICNGYPTSWYPLGTSDPNNSLAFRDSRNSERLRADLQAAGVLKSPDKDTPLVDYSSYSPPKYAQWRNLGLDAHVGVQCYGASFKSGGQPRVDFLFAKDFKLDKQADALAVEIRFVANNGQFRSDTRIEAISPKVIAQRVYRCQLPPWKPVAGSQARVTSQTGTVTFSLLFQTRRNGQLTTFRRVEFEPFSLDFDKPAEVLQKFGGFGGGGFGGGGFGGGSF